MATGATTRKEAEWRQRLPVLAGRTVTLREPVAMDHSALVELLSGADACRFGLSEPVSDLAVMALIKRVPRDRAAGLSFTYLVTMSGSRSVVGLIQIRQLDPTFETAECEATMTPSARGTGAFVEAARLTGSFLFGTIGAYRLECRVPVHNGRANGALRKLGGVEEGVLRRSVRRAGQYGDQVLWSILRDDWADNWVTTGPRVH
jgi:RimJ/RimL family protein N-acetyltransferase